MQQDLIEIRERKVCEDRCTNFRGTATVRLELLDFVDFDGFDVEESSDNTDNVERLKGIFKDEGCFRFEPENRISAIIDQQSLEDAIQATPLVASVETLLSNPKGVPHALRLPSNYRLKCLQGRSRVQAAKEFLPPDQRSWAVDLYLEDLSPELRAMLSEQYSNAARFSDGEIYQRMRHYQGDKFAEARWWARLSNNKQKNLKQLLKHDAFTAAFNALLPIPGFRSDFRIAMIPKIIAMKCDEENLHYLHHISDIWSLILGGDRELMGLADKATVEAMQLRIPALCSEDSKFLESLMSEGVLFPRLNNEQKLRHIWSNVLKVKCPIPTLFTFFEDIKWLMPLVKIMKRLLGKKFKGTVGKAMAQNFSGVNQSEEEVKVRETESTFRSYRGTLTDQVRLGVFQLWLFLARKFTDMISECPRKEEGQDKPVPKTPDIYVWHEFAVLAYNLGFECEEIHRLRSKNRDREIARAALLELEFFVDGSGENLKRRSGRTFVNAYAYDRQRLFLKAFLVPNRVGGKGITSLFVRVSVILAFFGELVLGSPKTPTTALSDILGQPVGPETEVFTLQQGGQMLTSSEKSEQETGLKEEVDRLRSELTRADEDRSKMREEMQKLVQQKADMEQTVGGLQTEASGLRNRVVDQEREVKQLRDDQVRARTEIDEYKDPTEKRIKALNMEIADLRREQESVQSNNQKLLDTCRKLEGELRKVEAAESQTSREYRRKIEELSTRNNELQQGFNRSQMTQSNALTDAENEKRKHLSEKEELQREVQQLRTKSHGLRQSLDKSAATQLAILNDYSTEKQKLLASKEKLQKDLDVSKTAHFDALEKTSTENKNLLDRSKVLLDEKEKLLVQINALQQELESCKTKLEEVSTEKKELSASHKQLLDENKKLLLKINEVELLAKHESKEEGLEAEADLLRNEKRGLEQRLADIGRLKTVWLARTEEVASLKAHLSQSLQDMEKMKKDADAELGIRLQIEKTNHTTQEQLNLKVLENQELQERVDSLVQRVASLEKEHQQMEEQERRAPDPSARLINFKYVNNNRIEQGGSIFLSSSEVERAIKKYMRKEMHPYTMRGRGLSAKNAFQMVTNDGSHTILLVPKGEEIEIDGKIITYPGAFGHFDLPPEQPNPFAGLFTATIHPEKGEPPSKRGKQ